MVRRLLAFLLLCTPAQAALIRDGQVTGYGQTVVTLDTGLDVNHPWFAGHVSHTFDFVTQTPDVTDTYGHGTHVSGIEIQTAPGVDLVMLKISVGSSLKDDALIGALQWLSGNVNAFRFPVTAVNMSFGTFRNDLTPTGGLQYEGSLKSLAEQDVMLFAACGNQYGYFRDPGSAYPANSPYVHPVMSTDATGKLSEWSQRHPKGIAVLGENVLSAWPGGGYEVKSGTSMASPLAVGLAALVRDWLTEYNLPAAGSDVWREMIRHAPPVQDVYGYDPEYFYHTTNLSMFDFSSVPLTPEPRGPILGSVFFLLLLSRRRRGGRS